MSDFAATDYEIAVAYRPRLKKYEGTVREFPDVAVYEKTPDVARDRVIDIIRHLQAAAKAQNTPIPPPRRSL